MTYPTYGSLVTKVSNDYDVTDENFISATELLGLFNEAIDDVEAIIHNLHHEDKYFMAPQASIALVNGTQDYALPSDIYANKIRHLWYENGSVIYELSRNRRLPDVKYIQSGELYSYLLVNDSTAGVRLRLFPTPTESGSFIKLWYIRNIRALAASLTDTANTLELPESANFIIQHVKRGIARKMRRADLVDMEDKLLVQQLALLETKLKEMVPDEDTLIPLDLSSYFDQGLGEVYQ